MLSSHANCFFFYTLHRIKICCLCRMPFIHENLRALNEDQRGWEWNWEKSIFANIENEKPRSYPLFLGRGDSSHARLFTISISCVCVEIACLLVRMHRRLQQTKRIGAHIDRIFSNVQYTYCIQKNMSDAFSYNMLFVTLSLAVKAPNHWPLSMRLIQPFLVAQPQNITTKLNLIMSFSS